MRKVKDELVEGVKAGNLLPWLLIVIGVVLVAAPMLTALAELIVDAAPPEIGTYSVVLKATDGTHVVQLSLMHLQIGEKVTLPLTPTQLLGVGLITVGVFMYVKEKRR